MSILRKLLSFVIPFAIFVCTLFFLLRTQEKVEEVKAPKIRREYVTLRNGDVNLYPHYNRAFAFPPGALVRVKKFWNEELVYDVNYDTNLFGIRITPGSESEIKSHFFNAGCSFTFGEGLPVEQTLSALMKLNNPEIDVVNYSQPGGGLHLMLMGRTFYPFSKLTTQQKGYFVYHFMSDHLNRWFADASYMEWAPQTMPYYKIEKGIPEFKGEIQDQSFYKDYQKTRGLGISKALVKVNGIIKRKDQWSDEELKEFSSGIAYLKKQYLKDFPRGKFLVFMHPMVDFNDENKTRFTKILNQKGIEVFDAHREFVLAHPDPDKNSIKHDGHPSALVNQWYSAWIKEQLKI